MVQYYYYIITNDKKEKEIIQKFKEHFIDKKDIYNEYYMGLIEVLNKTKTKPKNRFKDIKKKSLNPFNYKLKKK
jgi:poly-beta-hydroxyalkanoate depolymerase